MSVDWSDPNYAQFPRERQNGVQEKHYKFFTAFSISVKPHGPKFTNRGPDIGLQRAPSINLPNFVEFIDGVTDKNHAATAIDDGLRLKVCSKTKSG